MKEEEEKRKKEEEQQRKLISLRARKPPRRFAGRLLILPCPAGCGFVESSAEAVFGRAALGGFRGVGTSPKARP